MTIKGKDLKKLLEVEENGDISFVDPFDASVHRWMYGTLMDESEKPEEVINNEIWNDAIYVIRNNKYGEGVTIWNLDDYLENLIRKIRIY